MNTFRVLFYFTNGVPSEHFNTDIYEASIEGLTREAVARDISSHLQEGTYSFPDEKGDIVTIIASGLRYFLVLK